MTLVDRKEVGGILLTLVACVCWALYYLAGEFMLHGRTNLDPLTLAFGRFFIGGIVLFVYLQATHPGRLFQLTAREFGLVALMSLFSLVLMSSLLFSGQKYTSSVNAAMLMSLSPIITLLIGIATKTERPGILQILGIILTTGGCVILVGDGQRASFSLATMKGDLLSLGSAISWGIATVMGKWVITKENSFVVTVWSMIFASAFLLVANVVKEIIVPGSICLPENSLSWGYLAFLGLICTALAFWAWYAALGRARLSTVNALQNMEPLLAVLLAWILLDSNISPLKWCGIGIAFFGMLIVASPSPSPNQNCKGK